MLLKSWFYRALNNIVSKLEKIYKLLYTAHILSSIKYTVEIILEINNTINFLFFSFLYAEIL